MEDNLSKVDEEDILEKMLDALDLSLVWSVLSGRYYLRTKKCLDFVSYTDKDNGKTFFTVQFYINALRKILEIDSFHVPSATRPINILNPFFNKSLEEVQIMLDLEMNSLNISRKSV